MSRGIARGTQDLPRSELMRIACWNLTTSMVTMRLKNSSSGHILDDTLRSGTHLMGMRLL
jgi:hypothetical protein